MDLAAVLADLAGPKQSSSVGIAFIRATVSAPLSFALSGAHGLDGLQRVQCAE